MYEAASLDIMLINTFMRCVWFVIIVIKYKKCVRPGTDLGFWSLRYAFYLETADLSDRKAWSLGL
jgi:hypothetical protein